MRRETQHLILLLMGGAVLKISLNGNYARYVKPALGPWLAATGAAAMLLAVALIAASFRNKPPEHGHRHPSRMAWLLMVPALVLLFAPPPVLTVEQPSAQAQAAPADPALYPPLPPGQPPLKLIDFVGRALGAPATLDGREVSLVGFVRKLPDGLYLARVFIWCCAADARSVVLKLDVDPARFPAQDFADKQWVRLVGAYVPGSVDNDPEDIPTVRVVDVTPISPPENPYES